jgi:hypothetical protein
MGDGYVVNETGIAARIGELNACASEVASVIDLLGTSAGDLGPGDLPAAVHEVLDQWRSNLSDMRDKIDSAAENTRNALSNYQLIEDINEQRMRALAANSVIDQLEARP